MKLSNENLLEYLNEAGHSAQIQKETAQVALVLSIDNIDYPVFIRVLPKGPLIQIMVFIPVRLEPHAVEQTARQLHYFNKLIDLPGFGLDEAGGMVFYRVVLHAFEGDLPEKAFDGTIKALEDVCRHFTGAIAAVAGGALSFEEFIQSQHALK